jgi:hypothetical protein
VGDDIHSTTAEPAHEKHDIVSAWDPVMWDPVMSLAIYSHMARSAA